MGERFVSKCNALTKKNEGLYRDLAKGFGVYDCTFWILYLLRESDRVYTQSEICAILRQPKQSVNTALKNLEKSEMLRLEYANGKSKNIYLTEAGLIYAQETVDAVFEAEKSAEKALTESEKAMFLELYAKYLSAFEVETTKIVEKLKAEEIYDADEDLF